jgi:hypothetical protein
MSGSPNGQEKPLFARINGSITFLGLPLATKRVFFGMQHMFEDIVETDPNII